jgi:putative DNA primase/helicase
MLKLIAGGVSEEQRAKYLTMRRPCTDLGNSERLADVHGDAFRYCAELGGWHAYEGGRWFREGGEAGIKQAAKHAVRALGIEAMMLPESDATGRKEMYNHAKRSESNGAINAMIALAESAPPFASRSRDFDADPWLLNLRNGTLDLRTGALREHNPDDMITKVANYDFDPTATCPLWMTFIDTVLPDADTREFVQRLAGYAMTGVVRDRVLVVFHGRGDNGKSVLLRVLSTILGQYSEYAPHDLLIAPPKGSTRHPTELASLLGLRLSAMSEVDKDVKFNESLLKRLTGNEPIKARRMGCDFFEFEMTSKFVIAVNDLPKVGTDSKAVWNRIRTVPFKVTIDKDKIDTALFEKLMAEASGILNWMAAGCLEWQRQGLGTTKAIEAANVAYKAVSDDTARFFSTVYVADDSARTPRSEVFAAYEEWTAKHTVQPLCKSAFYKAAEAIGVKSVKVGVECLRVSLVPPQAPEESED